MTDRQKRALERKNKIVVEKFNLHSSSHSSFHFELDTTVSWNLLCKMSIQKWEEENNQKASNKVDKSIVRIVSLKDKNKKIVI